MRNCPSAVLDVTVQLQMYVLEAAPVQPLNAFFSVLVVSALVGVRQLVVVGEVREEAEVGVALAGGEHPTEHPELAQLLLELNQRSNVARKQICHSNSTKLRQRGQC